LQRTKNQFARDYILQRETNQQKALQLGHAVVITTTSRPPTASSTSSEHCVGRRSARGPHLFPPENRLILTILPSNGTGQGGR
jgi:hypothetical protein